MTVRQFIDVCQWTLWGLLFAGMLPVMLGALLDLWDRLRGWKADYTSGRDD